MLSVVFPLVDRRVNNVLLQTVPDVNEALLQLIDTVYHWHDEIWSVVLLKDERIACTMLDRWQHLLREAKFHYAILLANQLANWFAIWSATC